VAFLAGAAAESGFESLRQVLRRQRAQESH
jgi:hypothetical protein